MVPFAFGSIEDVDFRRQQDVVRRTHATLAFVPGAPHLTSRRVWSMFSPHARKVTGCPDARRISW